MGAGESFWVVAVFSVWCRVLVWWLRCLVQLTGSLEPNKICVAEGEVCFRSISYVITKLGMLSKKKYFGLLYPSFPFLLEICNVDIKACTLSRHTRSHTGDVDTFVQVGSCSEHRLVPSAPRCHFWWLKALRASKIKWPQGAQLQGPWTMGLAAKTDPMWKFSGSSYGADNRSNEVLLVLLSMTPYF